jgi:predicted dinucleotide-utilizing enzyme
MPKHVAKHDNRFDAAARYIKRCPNLTIPEAMKLADFSVQEAACRAKRMIVSRLLNKMKGVSALSPPSVINVSTEGTPASSESNISDATGQSSLLSMLTTPKVKRIRLTTTAAQMQRAAVIKKKRTINEAFKRATTMYDREQKKKKGGMSA